MRLERRSLIELLFFEVLGFFFTKNKKYFTNNYIITRHLMTFVIIFNYVLSLLVLVINIFVVDIKKNVCIPTHFNYLIHSFFRS